MQIPAPGRLELVQREVPAPGRGEVLLAVEACGICGADLGDIARVDPGERKPRLPGHKVVGRIVAIGDVTSSMWQIDQRVGVGRLGGHCSECPQCRQGKFHLWRNQPFVGSTCDGDHAEMMLVRGTRLGLSIVAKMVAAHGGDIELSRSPLGGLKARTGLPMIAISLPSAKF